MTTPMLGRSFHSAGALGLLLFQAACLAGCAGETVDTGPGVTSDSAIMIAAFVRSPEGRNIYVGAVPELPTGELDYSGFLEFGDVAVTAHDGHVFVWDREPARMTKYSVADDLRLVEGPTISFADHGLSGNAPTVYISETRAYTISPMLDLIVVWDPKEMVITGTIEMTPPEREDGVGAFPSEGYLAGDSVIWPVMSTNWDGVGYHPAASVVIAPAHTDGPVVIAEDDRCVGADGGYVDEEGNFYLRAGGYWGHTAAYAGERTCMLRINAGETAFDSDYLVDFEELTGTYVNFPWFHVEGTKYIAQAWDPEVPIPELIDDLWAGEGLKPLLVDIETGESSPYPDLEGHTVVSTLEFELDGVAYYQLSETGSAVGGSADIVELHSDGIVPRFTMTELWGLARIR